MKKMITLLAVLGMVLALAPAVQATPAPPFGHEGPYRIAFVTTGKFNATNTIIGPYNDFVTTAAGLVTELDDLGVEWKCLGSTSNDCAKTNTSTLLPADPGYSAANDVPIYTTTGLRIADDNADLWDGNIQNPIFYGDGTAAAGSMWTGTKTSGDSDDYSGDPSGPLGSGANGSNTGLNNNISVAGAGRTDHGWIKAGNAGGDTDPLHMLGMSGVVTAVAPTVATILISGSDTFIAPGDTTPSTGDDTDFGSVVIGGADISKTYTVTNFATAGADLTLSAPSISGSTAFEVTTGLGSTSLAFGQSTTFTVTYTAHSGARSVDDAKVSVASDATENDPYEFDITATTLNDGTVTTPGDGYTGPYRIAFVTLDRFNATNTIIGPYNTFVTTAATNVTELKDLGVEWKCLGSTKLTSAKVNTGTTLTDGGATDVPIYTTTGQRIADDNADLWDGAIQNPIFLEDGTLPVANTDAQWTGTDSDGSSASDTVNGGSYLGSGWAGDDTANYVRYVRGGYTDGGWISGVSNHDGYAGGSNPGGPAILYHFMALSDPIVPPPAGTVIIVK